MPFNLCKKYPELLELTHLSDYDRRKSLRSVFRRDIEDNTNFNFRWKIIRPIKSEGKIAMETLFNHLITEEVEVENEQGKKFIKRVFEIHRSQRLHWIKPHIEESIPGHVEAFSTEERKNGKTVFRTYLYNVKMKYVIVMEPQRSKTDYYLLSAFYLNKPFGEKIMMKKLKKKLTDIL